MNKKLPEACPLLFHYSLNAPLSSLEKIEKKFLMRKEKKRNH